MKSKGKFFRENHQNNYIQDNTDQTVLSFD